MDEDKSVALKSQNNYNANSRLEGSLDMDVLNSNNNHNDNHKQNPNSSLELIESLKSKSQKGPSITFIITKQNNWEKSVA